MKKIALLATCVLLLATAATAQDYKIGISYSQAIVGLTDIFSMRVLPPIPDKEPRFIGESQDGLLTLMLMGNTDNLWKATFIMNMAYLEAPVAERNAVAAGQFLQNLETGLDADGFGEMMDMIKQTHNHYKPMSLTEGDKKIEFLLIPSAYLMTITVSKNQS